VNHEEFIVQVVEQKILAQRIGRREVGFTPAQIGYFLNELDQPGISDQHEDVDQYFGTLALGHLFHTVAYHHLVQAEAFL
jgi:hypothetical protein